MTNPVKHRKLCAILFADIANYTAIMQKDEKKARGFLQKFRDTLETITAQFKGQIIQFYGDGCVCIFDSSVQALHCAKQLQEVFLSDPSVPVRIGLHSGDVFFEAGNVYGDSVNIASRIESLGMPGSVLLSDRVHKDTKNQPEFQLILIGKIPLKNVSDPIEIYAMDHQGFSIPDQVTFQKKIHPSHTHAKPGISPSSKWIIGGVFTIILVLVILNQFITPLLNSSQDEKLKLAVLNFENNTGDNTYTLTGKMAADRIIHGIAQNNLASLVTEETVETFSKMVKASAIPADPFDRLYDQFDVQEVISGKIYLDQEELVYECTISNAHSGEIIKGIDPVRCPISDPMQGIEELKQLVLGYIVLKEDIKQNLLLETHIPKHEAYKELLLAKSADNNEEMLRHLNLALAIDSQYFEAKVLKISCYYNLGSFAIADSLFKQIDNQQQSSDPRQKNLLLFYNALIKGKNDLIFQYLHREYELAPFDLETNNSMLVLALQFINDPLKASSFYQRIPYEILDYASCHDCQTRLYINTLLELESGKPDLALESGKLLFKYNPGFDYELLIRAFVQLGNWKELDQLIESLCLDYAEEEHSAFFLLAAKECLLENNLDKMEHYLAKSKNTITAVTPAFISGEIHYLMHDLHQAEEIFQEIINEDSTDLYALGFLAGICLQMEKPTLADQWMEHMKQQKSPYQYGEIDYQLARAFALGQNKEKALSHLQKSLAQGQRYTPNRYHHDYRFQFIFDDKNFGELLTYWW